MKSLRTSDGNWSPHLLSSRGKLLLLPRYRFSWYWSSKDRSWLDFRPPCWQYHLLSTSSPKDDPKSIWFPPLNPIFSLDLWSIIPIITFLTRKINLHRMEKWFTSFEWSSRSGRLTTSRKAGCLSPIHRAVRLDSSSRWNMSVQL